MHRNKKRFFIVFVISVIILLILIAPALYILLGKAEYRNNLNNQIIDSKYADWKEVNLDESIKIKIPDNWSLETGDRIVIRDDSQRPVAYGIKSVPMTDPLADFLQTYYGKTLISVDELTSLQEDDAPRVFWNGCESYIRISKYEDGSTSREIIIEMLYKYEYEYSFCFFYSPENETEYFKIAEAIAWSATW